MRVEELIATLERTQRRHRGNLLHEIVAAGMAPRPDSEAATITAALRAMGYGAAADEHENTRWESGFERRRLTTAARSAGGSPRQQAAVPPAFQRSTPSDTPSKQHELQR